jgi:ABC-2 type transport system permease protein
MAVNMASFIDYVNYFNIQCRIKLIRAMEFRFNFISGIFFSLILSCASPLFQFLIYFSTNGYPGWSFDQMILFQAVLLLWSGIIGFFLGNVRWLIAVIAKYGLFDRFLLMPYSTIGMIISGGFSYNSFGTLIAGILALIYSILKLHLILYWYHILLFLVFLFFGMLFYITIMIFYGAIAIKLILVERLFVIIDNLISFGNYPAEVFPGFAKMVYLVFFPIGIWIYFPAQVLLGRINYIAIWAVVTVGLLFIISIFIWNKQLKEYTSAGG